LIPPSFANPFNPTASVRVHVPQPGPVRLEMLDDQGQVVDVLLDDHLLAGEHLAAWNADRRPAGRYVYRLSCGGTQMTKGTVLVK
jgi:hypothetical protein